MYYCDPLWHLTTSTHPGLYVPHPYEIMSSNIPELSGFDGFLTVHLMNGQGIRLVAAASNSEYALEGRSG